MFQPDRLKDLLPTVVTHEAFSLGSLIAWLETQDLSTTYDCGDTKDCLLCRYAKSIGAEYFPVLISQAKNATPKQRVEVAACATPHDYKSALTRAREYAGRAK